MAQLKPYDLLAQHNYKGFTYKEVIHMLQHYGFERVNTGGGKHMVFKHRDYYPQIDSLRISTGAGEIEAIKVELAAKACMEVKRLNRERKTSEHLDPIPEWVSAALPSAFSQRVESDVMRVLAAPNGEPGRGYALKYKDHKLSVTSLNFPDQHFTFNCGEDDRKRVQRFTGMMTDLDAHVLSHMSDLRLSYERDIGKLQESGFEIRRDDPASIEVPMIHFSHPQYHLEYSLPHYRDNDAIPEHANQTIRTMMNDHAEHYYGQLDALETLAQQGWQVKQTRSGDGRDGMIAFERNGAAFSVTTHGALEMFDVQKAKALAGRFDVPTSVVSQTQNLMEAKGRVR